MIKVLKAIPTDVYTKAVWSPSISVVNSVAEERIPKLRKKEYSIKFSAMFLQTPPKVIVEKKMQKVVTVIVRRLTAGSPNTFTEKTRKSTTRTTRRSPGQ